MTQKISFSLNIWAVLVVLLVSSLAMPGWAVVHYGEIDHTNEELFQDKCSKFKLAVPIECKYKKESDILEYNHLPLDVTVPTEEFNLMTTEKSREIFGYTFSPNNNPGVGFRHHKKKYVYLAITKHQPEPSITTFDDLYADYEQAYQPINAETIMINGHLWGKMAIKANRYRCTLYFTLFEGSSGLENYNLNFSCFSDAGCDALEPLIQPVMSSVRLVTP